MCGDIASCTMHMSSSKQTSLITVRNAGEMEGLREIGDDDNELVLLPFTAVDMFVHDALDTT